MDRLTSQIKIEPQINLHDYQREPVGDWLIWVLKGGRGSGKTLAGAEWIWGQAKKYPYVGIAAATFGDARDFCVEGETGIKSLHPELQFNRSMGEMTFPSGARGKLFSGEEPERGRGPNLYALWCDEFCSWKQQAATWDNLMFALRKGESKTLITTTPKPSKLWLEIQKRRLTRVVTATTYQNIDNLSRAYVENVIKPYEGTRKGRQELNAEDIEDIEGALWNRDMIERGRVTAAQNVYLTAIGVDPSTTDTDASDEAGVITAAAGLCNCKGFDERHVFIMDDSSLRGSPQEWATAAVSAYNRYHANQLVAESNQGGQMVSLTISTIRNAPPVSLIHAKESKRVRAEPVVMLYEQNKVHHVGYLAGLEDEMCNWQGTSAKSPNRIDALVYAVMALGVGADQRVVLFGGDDE